MQPIAVVKKILGDKYGAPPKNKIGQAFAPANIALCKYWGKREVNLNLPVTSSLSISLRDKGARTRITLATDKNDVVTFNHRTLSPDTMFVQRVIDFINLFRAENDYYFSIDTCSNIAISSGLASSAAGFAALVQALDQLFGWQLDKKSMSILARLGSGSACRSLWHGFVKWNVGSRADGLDSFSRQLPFVWKDLTIGLLPLTSAAKSVSSREAMQRTVETSRYYQLWSKQVEVDMQNLLQAIEQQDFQLLGETAERNALAMHALALTAMPAILYSTAATIAAIHKIWHLRKVGMKIYFTQDAGANLVLLFLQQDLKRVTMEFAELEIIAPFEDQV